MARQPGPRVRGASSSGDLGVRALERPNIQLPTLHGSGKGATQAARDVSARQRDPTADLDFPDHWNKPDVRGALHAMQGFACAYCQRELEGEQGQVDHVRPKNGGPEGGYFWLAYDFSNFHLACTCCNRFKGNQFPLLGAMAHVTYETRNAIALEVPLLPDPTSDPVDQWFELEWQDSERRVDLRLISSLIAGCIERQRAEKMLDVFRINAEFALVRARIQALHKARPGIDSGKPELLRQAACRYLPQGAIVHAFLKAVRPELLPTPQEELFVFLEELFDRWELAIRICKDHPAEEGTFRRLEQLHWAFAVIWACPLRQCLSPDEIRNWLEPRKLLPFVEPLYRRLTSPISSTSPKGV